MALLTESEVRGLASTTVQRLRKSAEQVLREDRALSAASFDVFLSHSSSEPVEILLGVKAILEGAGLTVYVDKYSDPHLSPDRVTTETAQILRNRMRQSRSLLYVYSQHSQKSRWMPWELGFFDGYKGRVGVIPVTRYQEETFKGEEYLNLYPYVDHAENGGGTDQLWVNESSRNYAWLYGWIKGTEEIRTRT